MFINIRATNGAGKSSLVREAISASIKIKDIFLEGKKRPIYTIWELCFGEENRGRFATIGHYETACGGCDAINKVDDVFKYTEEAFTKYGVNFVLAEGMILSKDVSRTPKTKNPKIIFMDLPLAECYEGVKQRRIIQGADQEKINTPPKTLEGNYKGIASACRRIQGVDVHKVTTRQQARQKLYELMEEASVI